jgi:GTP cyclohydrolase I
MRGSDQSRTAPDLLRLAAAFETILSETIPDWAPGTAETPGRCAKAWVELTAGYDVDIEALFKTFDGEDYDEMVAVCGIPFSSMCEHHMLPFSGHAHVVYLPGKRVPGLSKIPRLVDAYARRLQQQERLTMQIADALVANLDPVGVLVMVEAEHLCMKLRGARSHGKMRTSVTRGAMRDKPAARAEALALIERNGAR